MRHTAVEFGLFRIFNWNQYEYQKIFLEKMKGLKFHWTVPPCFVILL